ncbi:hypothetical protein D3C80_1922710 [compost metagenome]
MTVRLAERLGVGFSWAIVGYAAVLLIIGIELCILEQNVDDLIPVAGLAGEQPQQAQFIGCFRI